VTDQVQALVEVMQRLRQECPWDQRQTHESLREYLLEETYELLEAIDLGDLEAMREELGDLLLQVVFHAQIASETQEWDLHDVAQGIAEKLIRRHPHVFEEGASAEQVELRWHHAKAVEKGRASVTEGIPAALPALARAQKVEARSAHLELPEHAHRATAEQVLDGIADEQELGALLLALAASARDRDWDAEAALRQAISDRVARIREVE
jgi:XTP/dITP diphosphohydrolase